MTAEQAAEAGKSLSFESVWAAMMETDARMRRLSEEADLRHKELEKVLTERHEEADLRHREADVRLKELKQLHKETERAHTETEKALKRVTENIGRLNNATGELVEILVAARLWEKFPEYGLKRAFRQVPVYDENGCSMTEIDILLSNTDRAMAVEVKTSLSKTKQVDWHLKRMELVRQYPPAEIAINGKRLLGAIAGGFVDAGVAKYAQQCGLYVLELSGESVRRMPSPPEFTPREW
jgi:predicted RecB family endonuclease